MDLHAVQRYFKARPVTYFRKEKVERELASLQELGIIIPVQHPKLTADLIPYHKHQTELSVLDFCSL